MDIKKEKTNRILLIITIILLFTYLLSFTKLFSSDKRKIIKSALVNSKYKELITSFELFSDSGHIFFEKKGDIWFGTNFKDKENYIPLDNEIISKFIDTLCSVTQMYVVTDRISQKNSYGLLSDSAFHIKYFFNDSKSNEILIGDSDFSQSARYLMGSKNTTVYQINNSLENYLNLSLQFWSEPYVISKKIFNNDNTSIQRIIIDCGNIHKVLTPSADNYNDKVSSLLEMRHGGIVSEKTYKYIKNHIILEPELKIKFEKGNKSEVLLSFFRTEEEISNEIIVKCEYPDKKSSFYYRISQWTYNRYKEIIL